MLAHCLDNIDMLSEHFYSTSGKRTDLQTGEKVNTETQPLIEVERAPATQVRVKYEHYQEYLKRIPGLKEKPVPISLDEWAYIGAPPNRTKWFLLMLGRFMKCFVTPTFISWEHSRSLRQWSAKTELMRC